MSGGHFNHSGYIYYQVDQFADELEIAIENNDKLDDFEYAHHLNGEVIAVLKEQIGKIRKVAKIMKAIDYLYSADYGEDSFLKAMKRVEESV